MAFDFREKGPKQNQPEVAMPFPIEAILFVFLMATAVVIARLQDLFAASMLTGIFSLLSAGLFTLMDAVDVAFTEAAVGAGISTVLLLGALSLSARKEYQRPRRVMPFVVVAVTGAALIFSTLDMPHYGDPAAPIHHHVAPDYIEGTRTDFGLPNIVTAVLASYRGLDTLGETAVVFTAAVGVLMLLVGDRKRKKEEKK
jgi:multicomponent Na+:H+ antiporter subunit B